ncbi:PilN domain-containing protein, partial [Candidatus Parcubacteria bacterium]|nr:PilN domain-containing protein [Candidatus Parcubacteria bacterium]
RKLKLILIFELGFLLFLISIALIAFSVSTYLGGEIDSEKTNIFQKEQDIDLDKIADFQKEIKVLNEKTKDIDTFYHQQTYLAGILEKISEKLPAGSYLNNLSFSQTSNTLNLSGFVLTRDDLLTFKRSIESDNNFTDVNFPPGNWVSPTNIEFSLSFKLKPSRL